MNSIFYFLINPFAGFIQAFRYKGTIWAKNSIMLFVVFYGFTMAKPEEKDSSRYVQKLEFLHSSDVSWNIFIANFYNEEGGSVDIYQPLTTYLVSLFTDNGNILFAIFGLVFGFFYSRNIFFVINKSKIENYGFAHWILLITFICVIGFWELNGVRMWTAAQIFLYGVLHFFDGKKKIGLIAIFSCIFVHFSFVLLIGLFLLYIFVKIPIKLLYVLYVMTFFVSALNLQAVGNLLQSIAPEFLLPRVKSYTSEDYAATIAEMNDNANFYVGLYKKILSWFLLFFVSLVYFFKMEKLKSNPFLYKILGFSLVLISVGNLTSLMPSGIRYLIIAQYFLVGFVFMFLVVFKEDQSTGWVSLLSPMLIAYLLVAIRISFDTITLETILFNPLFSFITDLQIPLIDLIK